MEEPIQDKIIVFETHEKQLANTNNQSEKIINMKQLSHSIYNEVNKIVRSSGKDCDVIQTIMSQYRQSDNISDILSNIKLMIPSLDEMADSFDHRGIFLAMYENTEKLQIINIDIGELCINIQGIMNSYKSKLENLCKQIQLQVNVRQELGIFIKFYCEKIKFDFEHCNKYEKIIEDILKKISEIRKLDLTIQSDKIKKTFQQILLYVSSSSSIFDQKNIILENEIEKQRIIIEQFRNKIVASKSRKIQLSQEMEDFPQKIEILDKDILKIQTEIPLLAKKIDDKNQQRLGDDFEEMRKQKTIELQQYNLKISNQISEMRINLQKKKEEYHQCIRQKLQEIQNVSKSYHIILLIDDSQSMHVKDKGMLYLFQQTPFDLLNESVKQFIRTRRDMNQNKDLISIIKFSNRAYKLNSREKIQDINVDLKNNPLKGGTNFNEAFKEVAELMKLQTDGMSQILIFQTDGESDQKSHCYNYLKEIQNYDKSFSMFTLGLGSEINEQFLREITKFANNGQEIMNQGKCNPLHYFQKVIKPDQLNRIFTDISFGIAEQQESVNFQLKQKQNQMEIEENIYKLQLTEIENQYKLKEKQLQQQFSEMKNIHDKNERIQFLQSILENENEKLQNLNKKRSELQAEKKNLQQKILEEDKKITDLEEEFKKVQIDCQNEITKKKDLVSKQNIQTENSQLDIFQKIQNVGETDETKLKLWSNATDQFDSYLRILSVYMNKFNSFFCDFKRISDNLKDQIEMYSGSPSNKIEFHQQANVILQYFQAEIILSQNFNKDLSFFTITDVFKIILQDILSESKCSKKSDKQQFLLTASNLIIDNFLEFNDFLNEIKFNQSQEADKKQQKTKLNKIKQQFKEKLIDQENLQIEQQALIFTELKIVTIQQLEELEDKQQIQDIMTTISEFEIPDSDNSQSEEDNNEEDDEDSDDDDDQERQKKKKIMIKQKKIANKLKQQEKNQKAAEKKKLKVASKKKKKADFDLQKNNLKIAMQNKIAKIKQINQFIAAIDDVFQLCENKIESILFENIQSKKPKQIKAIIEYINKDILNPLIELIEFQTPQKHQ